MRIAPEGYPFIAGGVIVAIAVHWLFGGFWAVVFWLFALFMLQFFRDPVRRIPVDANAIVSPADGKIVSVQQASDPVSGELATKIAIFLNVFSVHATRIPIAGEVSRREYRHGKFFNAALEKASEDNESNSIVIQTEDSEHVTLIQVAGLVARRILCYVTEGDRVDRGQRYGFIRFGSRVEVFLPRDYSITVSVGDKVRGGSDIIGYVN